MSNIIEIPPAMYGRSEARTVPADERVREQSFVGRW